MDKVSVCFITYNRLQTLIPTYERFLQNTDYPREDLELIVCDDASPKAVQEEIRKMGFDKYVFNKKRKGLGRNQNNGIRAATGDYILQLQDDWDCIGPADYIKSAVGVMKDFDHIGMVLLRPHPAGNVQKESLMQGSTGITVFDNIPGRKLMSVGEGAYTDWPHLKKRKFHDVIGPYKEKVPMWDMELDFCQRVNDQEKLYVAHIEGHNIFTHTGKEFSFNTGNWKTRIARQLQKTTLGDKLVRFYKVTRGRAKK